MDISSESFSISDDNLNRLKEKWLSIEQKSSNVPFFLSWHWIGNWVQNHQDDLYLVEVKDDDKLLGLGLLVKASKRVGWLHKTGDERSDQIWIEYNDFLLVDENKDVIRREIIKHLLTDKNMSIHKLHFDMTIPFDPQTNKNFLVRTKYTSKGYSKSLVPKVDLQGLLSTFSKNTRRQITTSQRLLQQQGLLELDVIPKGNKNNALAAIAKIHIEQWGQSQWGSGFENNQFTNFHYGMVEQEAVSILKLTLDNKALAYGYYFCFNKRVYFYLSAIHKASDNRIKVGLLFHALAMEYFSNKGYEIYDFLAGEARYKKSLSDQEYLLQSNCFTKNTLLSRTEQWLRELKHKIIKRVNRGNLKTR